MAEEDPIYTKLKLIMPHYSTATRQGSQYAGFSWTNDQQALIFIPWTSYDDSKLPTVELNDYNVADPEFELAKSNIYSLVRNHYYGSEEITSEKGEYSKDDPVFDPYRYLTVQIYYAGSWQKFGETHRVEFEEIDVNREYNTLYSIRGDKLFANPDVLFGPDEMLPIYLAPRKAYIRVCLGEQPDGSDANDFVAGYYVASDIYTYYNLYNAVALMGYDGYGSDYDLANTLGVYITAYDENHLFLDQDKGDSNVQAHTHGIEPVKTTLSGGKYIDVASVTPDIRSGDLISEANPDNAYIYSQPVTGISYSKLLGVGTDKVDAHQIDSINYYIVDADGQPVFYHTEANKLTFDAANLLSNDTNFKLVPGVSRINTNGTMQLTDLVIEHVFKNKADNDKECTVAVKFHQAVALNIAREGAEEMPEEPSTRQRVVTTTDLDQTIIVTPQKKVAVNVDNKTIGLINGKLGVLGGAGVGTSGSAPSGFRIVDTIGPTMPSGDYFFMPHADTVGGIDFALLDITDVPGFGQFYIRSDNRYGVGNADKPDYIVCLPGDRLDTKRNTGGHNNLCYGVKAGGMVTLYFDFCTNVLFYGRFTQRLVCARNLEDSKWNVLSNTITVPRYFKGRLNNIAKNFIGDMSFTCFLANEAGYGIRDFPKGPSAEQEWDASETLWRGKTTIAHVKQSASLYVCTQRFTYNDGGVIRSFERVGTRRYAIEDFTFSKWKVL